MAQLKLLAQLLLDAEHASGKQEMRGHLGLQAKHGISRQQGVTGQRHALELCQLCSIQVLKACLLLLLLLLLQVQKGHLMLIQRPALLLLLQARVQAHGLVRHNGLLLQSALALQEHLLLHLLLLHLLLLLLWEPVLAANSPQQARVLRHLQPLLGYTRHLRLWHTSCMHERDRSLQSYPLALRWRRHRNGQDSPSGKHARVVLLHWACQHHPQNRVKAHHRGHSGGH